MRNDGYDNIIGGHGPRGEPRLKSRRRPYTSLIMRFFVGKRNFRHKN